MSQSQQSDFASSLYDGEIDNISYPTSSNYLATPSGSQYTLDVSDQDFIGPNIPLAAPSFFTRVGPDRRKVFILYDRMAHSDWVEWWLQTDFGRKSKINWDSTRHAEIWSHYRQVAHSADGALKVMCQRCGAILEHPYTVNPKADGKIQYHGTSTMQKNLKTAGCLKCERGKRAEITRFLKNGVCSYISARFSAKTHSCYYYFADLFWVPMLGRTFSRCISRKTLGKKTSCSSLRLIGFHFILSSIQRFSGLFLGLAARHHC